MTQRESTSEKTLNAKQRAFLAAYATNGTITHAALAAGIDRGSHYNWLADPGYVEAFTAAGEQAVDALEREARRRAIEGVEKPVYQGGKKVGTVREYSDTLLIFTLKGARPEKYRERYTVDQNTTVTVRSELDAEISGLLEELGGLGQSPAPVAATNGSRARHNGTSEAT